VVFGVTPERPVHGASPFPFKVMNSIAHDLGKLLLQAVPTAVLLIFVHLYLKFVFFKPLQGVLKERRQATEGAQEGAEKSLAVASEKAAMYEIAIKEARGEMYKEQEETRRHWLDHQAARIEEARHRTHNKILQASQTIATEVENAGRELASSSQMLALQIVETLARGRMK
jgi:F0F1-type ATP synthase membrane subunit b/b'